MVISPMILSIVAMHLVRDIFMPVQESQHFDFGVGDSEASDWREMVLKDASSVRDGDVVSSD